MCWVAVCVSKADHMTCLLWSDWLSCYWLGRWWIRHFSPTSPIFHSISSSWWIITYMEWITSTSVLSNSEFLVPLVILHHNYYNTHYGCEYWISYCLQKMTAQKWNCCLPLRSIEGDRWPHLSSLLSLPPRPVPPFSSIPARVSGMSTHCQGMVSLSLSLSLSLLSNIFMKFSFISDLILCEPRRSVTELEVDILAADILNRHELSLGRSMCLLLYYSLEKKLLYCSFRWVSWSGSHMEGGETEKGSS